MNLKKKGIKLGPQKVYTHHSRVVYYHSRGEIYPERWDPYVRLAVRSPTADRGAGGVSLADLARAAFLSLFFARAHANYTPVTWPFYFLRPSVPLSSTGMNSRCKMKFIKDDRAGFNYPNVYVEAEF